MIMTVTMLMTKTMIKVPLLLLKASRYRDEVSVFVDPLLFLYPLAQNRRRQLQPQDAFQRAFDAEVLRAAQEIYGLRGQAITVTEQDLRENRRLLLNCSIRRSFPAGPEIGVIESYDTDYDRYLVSYQQGKFTEYLGFDDILYLLPSKH